MPTSQKISKQLEDTGTGLLYTTANITREVILSLNMGRIYYVNATDGDDTTASRGRFDKPYKTIQAAVSAAPNTGDIIEVMTGTYNENVTGKVSGFVHLVLRSANINGNVNVNNNSGSGRIYLLQGSVINGNIIGTFGSGTISDKTGIVNGEIGSNGDNGGHFVSSLFKWTSTTQNAVLGPNYVIENINEISCSGEWNFRSQNNQDTLAGRRNGIIRNVGLIRNSSALATARVFNPVNEVAIDTLENVGLIVCDNGKIYNDLFRPLNIYRCKNVTFKSKLESFFGFAISGNFYDCRFICTDERIMRIYEHATTPATRAKFYNCHFESAAAATDIFAVHDVNKPLYMEFVNCLYNKATLISGAQPTTLITLYTSYLDTLSIRTDKVT